jgi:hypothetical protein
MDKVNIFSVKPFNIRTTGVGTYITASGDTITINKVPVGDISATGTPDSTTFLRGDGVWATVSSGAAISVVANYSSLPSAAAHNNEFYWASAKEGTYWLPGSWGGDYYPAGLYHSNGATWEYMNTPSATTASDLDTGTQTDRFVTPKVIADSHNVPHVVPSTSGNVMTSNGTDWISSAPASSGLSFWTESHNTSAPNNTVGATRLLVTASGTNNDAVIEAEGTGATLAQLPDSTTTGGNKRGAYATDFQKIRANANQVASGTKSVLMGGENNSAVGTSSCNTGGLGNASTGNYSSTLGGASNSATQDNAVCVGGSACTASGAYSATVSGDQTVASGDWSCVAGGYRTSSTASFSFATGRSAKSYLPASRAFASGLFATQADAQEQDVVIRAERTGTTAIELLTNGAQLLIPNNTIWNVDVRIVAVVTTAGNGTGGIAAGDSYGTKYNVVIKNIGGTTALVGTAEEYVTAKSDGTMSTSVTACTADNSNDALAVKYTPPSTAGTTTVIRAVAYIDITEVAY